MNRKLPTRADNDTTFVWNMLNGSFLNFSPNNWLGVKYFEETLSDKSSLPSFIVLGIFSNRDLMMYERVGVICSPNGISLPYMVRETF